MDCVRRRYFLAVTWAILAAPLASDAQQPAQLPRIGYLAFNSAVTNRPRLSAFRETLRELGWIDGQNIVIETRFADGEFDRLPALIDELLMLKPDLIVTGSSAVTRASRSATTTLPIVMLASAD